MSNRYWQLQRMYTQRQRKYQATNTSSPPGIGSCENACDAPMLLQHVAAKRSGRHSTLAAASVPLSGPSVNSALYTLDSPADATCESVQRNAGNTPGGRHQLENHTKPASAPALAFLPQNSLSQPHHVHLSLVKMRNQVGLWSHAPVCQLCRTREREGEKKLSFHPG